MGEPARVYEYMESDALEDDEDDAARGVDTAALQQAHRDLVSSIQEATALGDEGVLASGNALNVIVTEAMAQMEEAASSMQGAEHADGSLGQVLNQKSDEITRYLSSFDAATEGLASGVARATEACRSIASFVGEFDSATLTCDALAMYMKVEVARLPQKDQHVGVIADELKVLSSSVRQLANTVRSVSVGLLRELPAVAASVQRTRARRLAVSSSIQESVADIGGIARQLEAVLRLSAADGASSEVVRCSQEALSRHQYHDPLIQEVQTLDGLAAELCTTASASAEAFEPLVYAVRLGGDAGSDAGGGAGEVDLF